MIKIARAMYSQRPKSKRQKSKCPKSKSPEIQTSEIGITSKSECLLVQISDDILRPKSEQNRSDFGRCPKLDCFRYNNFFYMKWSCLIFE